jgi:lysophospholipase L1-like esterase
MSAEGPQFKWFSPNDPPFRLAGFAWFQTDGVYRRLPLKPSKPLPPAVDSLANSTAGGQIQFQTDSTRVAVRVQLAGPAGMDHMPSTGQCGFDCYVGPAGEQRYVSTTRMDLTKTAYEHVLFNLPAAGVRNVTLNFPLYQGVKTVEVGLNEGSQVLAPPPFTREGRVVVYGTSITQGGCAARPGMAYTNILSRRLNVEFINLGFSGSGRGEAEVAEAVAQVAHPICFVLDYEANCVSTELLRETLPRFIRILRAAHAGVPILVVSRTPYAVELQNEESARAGAERREFQRATVEKLRSEGDALVFFKDGSDLLGEDFDECTVDGGHPTDLGFLRMANGLEPVLRWILTL